MLMSQSKQSALLGAALEPGLGGSSSTVATAKLRSRSVDTSGGELRART